MQTRDKVSIQLPLGGHSFSLDSLPADDVAMVEVVVDTHKVVLAPREEVSLDTAEQLLQLVGKRCLADEVSVCSELQEDVVAVMAVKRTTLEYIVERFGAKTKFWSPLLDMRHAEESCLTVDWSDDVCYMRLFDGGLQRAEAIAVATADDLLYNVVEWIGDRDIPIYIKGERKVAKLLARYFRRVICE
jgi:hypothetical protein